MEKPQKSKSGLYGAKDPLGRLLSWCRNRKVLPLIRGEFVDLACGDNRLVEEYGRGTGVDVVDYGKAQVVLKDFTKLPFPDKSVETVTIIASLNYFDDPSRVVKEINRILKKDGRLILTMPNTTVMKIWHKFREPWAKESGFSVKEVRKIADSGGMRIIKRKRFMFGVNNIFILVKS